MENRTLREIRKSRRQKSDLILLEGNIDEQLKALRIKVVDTPKYSQDYQIDELVFGEALLDEISYYGRQALAHDINSIRSVYVKRQGATPVRLEDARAVFVTTNSAFARVAFQQGRNHNSSREVSPVITDYALANIAWLKAPLKKPTLPERETLALCYAGLEPSAALVEKYVRMMDEMRARGAISADDHAILRASAVAQMELMNLTQGDDEALTEQDIGTILDRAKQNLAQELKDVHAKQLEEEERTRRRLQEELEEQRKSAIAAQEAHTRAKQRIADWAALLARWLFLGVFVVVGVLLLLGSLVTAGLIPSALDERSATHWVLLILAVGTLIWGLYNWLSGRTLKALLAVPENKLARWIARMLMPD